MLLKGDRFRPHPLLEIYLATHTYKYIFNDKGFERLGELTELYDFKYRQKV